MRFPRKTGGLAGDQEGLLLQQSAPPEDPAAQARRTPQNPLFPVNLSDLLIRHTGGNHKRETIAFSKRRQGALYRIAV